MRKRVILTPFDPPGSARDHLGFSARALRRENLFFRHRAHNDFAASAPAAPAAAALVVRRCVASWLLKASDVMTSHDTGETSSPGETVVARPCLGPLHEGRVPLGRVRGYSMRCGGSCSTHTPWPVHPHPRAVRQPKEGSRQGQVEPAPPGSEQVSHKVRRVRGRPDPPQGPGLDHVHGSVSTQRTSAASPSTHPTGILGILRFLLGLQRLGGVDVRCMDIYDLPDRPHQLVAASKTAGPAGSPTEASTSEAMTLTCLRSEETRQLAVQ